MGFPLIQEPAPLQQLADTINGIVTRRHAVQQQRFENEQAKADSVRRDAYLNLNQQEAVDRQKQFEQTNALAMGEAALHQAQLAATLQSQAAAQMDRQQDNKRQLLQVMLQHLPPGITMSLARAQREAAGGKYLPGMGTAPPTMEQDIATAQGRAVVGRQGSIIRDPVAGESNGITFTPHTLNYNAPNPGAGNTLGNERHQLRLANLNALVGATNDLATRERTNPVNAQRPWASVIGGVAAGLVRKVGGERSEPFAQAAENVGLNNQQTEYQGTAEQWLHNYLPNLPGFRMSVPMFNSAKHAFFPPPGETNPDVVQSFTRRREAVVRALVAAQQGGEPETVQAARVAAQLRAFGAPDAATEIERHVGGSVGTRTAPAGAPGSRTPRTAPVPFVDPRFHP